MIDLETMSDVVALLKTKDARDKGIEESVFHKNGLASVHAVAQGLRARGYEIEVFGPRGGAEIAPRLNARRRCQASQEGPSTTLRSAAPQETTRAIRGSSMTGRQLYEKYCELRLRRPDWHRLDYEARDAWDALALWIKGSAVS